MKILLMLLLLPFYAAADSHCKTSEWGPDDQIGAANRITEMSVIEAAKLVKTGKTYSLGLTIDANTPAFAPRSLSLTVVQTEPAGGRPTLSQHDLQRRYFQWLARYRLTN